MSISVTFNTQSGTWTDFCQPFGSHAVHTLKLDAPGWRRLSMRGGPNIGISARARREGDGVVVSLLPFDRIWTEREANHLRFASPRPGSSGQLYWTRRNPQPMTGCGRLAAFVTIAE